jgi:hypothetical protein
VKSGYLIAVAGLLAGATVLGVAKRTGRTVEPRPPAESLASSSSGIPAWLSDPDAAAAVAVASGKDLLVEFDAPGSTGGSAKTGSEVFDTEAFRRSAGEAFVMVRLGSSADAPADSAARVAVWGERLGVTRFPAVVLLDSRGRPYADTVWDEKESKASVQILRQLRQVKTERDAELAAAKRATALDRARHLDAALHLVGRFAACPAYVEVMREIVSLDKSNAAGLKGKYAGVMAGIDVDVAIQSEVYPMIDKGDLAGAIARIDQLMVDANPPAGQRQLLLAFKGQLYFSLHDTRGASKAFDEAMRIDPNSETAAKVLAARQQVLGGAS